jgi:hypothetical protein
MPPKLPVRTQMERRPRSIQGCNPEPGSALAHLFKGRWRWLRLPRHANMLPRVAVPGKTLVLVANSSHSTEVSPWLVTIRAKPCDGRLVAAAFGRYSQN